MAISVVPSGGGVFAFYTALTGLHGDRRSCPALGYRCCESLTVCLPFVTVFFKSTFWMILLLDMMGTEQSLWGLNRLVGCCMRLSPRSQQMKC